MKYVLLIDEMSEDTLPDSSISFQGFEDIDWHSDLPFDDRASINYDAKLLDSWKAGVLALTNQVFAGKKVSISVIRIKDSTK